MACEIAHVMQDISLDADSHDTTEHVLVMHAELRSRDEAGRLHERHYICPTAVLEDQSAESCLSALDAHAKCVTGPIADRNCFILATDSAKSLARLGRHFAAKADAALDNDLQ